MITECPKCGSMVSALPTIAPGFFLLKCLSRNCSWHDTVDRREAQEPIDFKDRRK